MALQHGDVHAGDHVHVIQAYPPNPHNNETEGGEHNVHGTVTEVNATHLRLLAYHGDGGGVWSFRWDQNPTVEAIMPPVFKRLRAGMKVIIHEHNEEVARGTIESVTPQLVSIRLPVGDNLELRPADHAPSGSYRLYPVS
jgi:hypothetical protein